MSSIIQGPGYSTVHNDMRAFVQLKVLRKALPLLLDRKKPLRRRSDLVAESSDACAMHNICKVSRCAASMPLVWMQESRRDQPVSLLNPACQVPGCNATTSGVRSHICATYRSMYCVERSRLLLLGMVVDERERQRESPSPRPTPKSMQHIVGVGCPSRVVPRIEHRPFLESNSSWECPRFMGR